MTTTEEMPRYKLWQVVLTLVLGPVGVGLVGSTIAAVVVSIAVVMGSGGDLDVTAITDATQSFPSIAVSLLVTALGFIGGPAVLAYATKRPVARTLGLAPMPHPATFLLAPLGMIALGPTSDRIVQLAELYIPTWTFGALGQIDAIVGRYPIWMMLPFIAVCPGFGEEILFRGFIQRSIGKGAVAILVSAITFAAIHVDPHHVLGVVPLGLYLAWVANRTDSTWPTIVAHTANNAMAVVATKLTGESDVTAHAPLGYVIAGWVVCALSMVAIARVDRPARASSGPAPGSAG